MPVVVLLRATPLTVNPVPTAPAAPTASVTVQPTCATPTGTIVVTAPIGAGLTYSIDGTNYQAGTTFTGVAPGPYNVTVQACRWLYFCTNCTHCKPATSSTCCTNSFCNCAANLCHTNRNHRSDCTTWSRIYL